MQWICQSGDCCQQLHRRNPSGGSAPAPCGGGGVSGAPWRGTEPWWGGTGPWWGVTGPWWGLRALVGVTPRHWASLGMRPGGGLVAGAGAWRGADAGCPSICVSASWQKIELTCRRCLCGGRQWCFFEDANMTRLCRFLLFVDRPLWKLCSSKTSQSTGVSKAGNIYQLGGCLKNTFLYTFSLLSLW